MEMLIPSISLLIVTVFASYLYYKKILEAKGEYVKSQNIIRDITFGFTRQVKRISIQISKIENDVQDAYNMGFEAKISSEKSLKIIENIKFDPNEIFDKFINQQSILNNHSKLIGEQKEVINSYEKELGVLKEEVKNLASKPQVRQIIREVDAPITVDESDILSKLTSTEYEVLTLMQNMGFSSVPQIKQKIGKTREHTARLLKKLFEKGFIDRNTTSMPYKYQVRKEVRDLIKDKVNITT